MRTAQHLGSSSTAALVAGFPRGPRIAFAPETGAGSGPMAGAKPNPVKKDASKKDDEDEPDKIDKLLAIMQTLGDGQNAINSRLDALESKDKSDAAKDPDDLTEAEKEAKADAASLSGVDREMADIKSRMPLSERQRLEAAKEDAITKVQVRADAAFNLHGKRCPPPLAGEGVIAYRVRVLRDHQKFSEAFRGVDLSAIAKADEEAFKSIEDRILLDSAEASKRPAGPEDGTLMARTRFDKDMQRNITEYFGRSSYAKLMSPMPQRFQGFRIEPRAY